MTRTIDMVARKRRRDEIEEEAPVEEPSMLHKLRNMWHFANLVQYLTLFKGPLKLDGDLDIEVGLCASCAHHALSRIQL